MDEILWYDYSNESSVTSTVLSPNGTIYLVCSSSFFVSVDESKSYGVTIQIYLFYFICHTIIITKNIGKVIVAGRPNRNYRSL